MYTSDLLGIIDTQHCLLFATKQAIIERPGSTIAVSSKNLGRYDIAAALLVADEVQSCRFMDQIEHRTVLTPSRPLKRYLFVI